MNISNLGQNQSQIILKSGNKSPLNETVAKPPQGSKQFLDVMPHTRAILDQPQPQPIQTIKAEELQNSHSKINVQEITPVEIGALTQSRPISGGRGDIGLGGSLDVMPYWRNRNDNTQSTNTDNSQQIKTDHQSVSLRIDLKA